MTRDIGKGAEAKERCASCVCISTGSGSSYRRESAVPTMRQGVQSSNCALSFLRASLKVGGDGGCSAIAVTAETCPRDLTKTLTVSYKGLATTSLDDMALAAAAMQGSSSLGSSPPKLPHDANLTSSHAHGSQLTLSHHERNRSSLHL
ncbi:hypothetical protein IG631_07446 [Alternaria alternata]|nr:hypothetical protein IG631_07446 [Alternaria alternata]